MKEKRLYGGVLSELNEPDAALRLRADLKQTSKLFETCCFASTALANVAAASARQTISRGYTSMQIVDREALSTASRRGTLEMPVNRPYEETVEGESQPRAGTNRTSSTMLTKKRPASRCPLQIERLAPRWHPLSANRFYHWC